MVIFVCLKPCRKTYQTLTYTRRNTTVVLMTAALMACYITVNAQTEPKFKPSIDQLYLTVDEVPNAVYWLPAPPEPVYLTQYLSRQ